MLVICGLSCLALAFWISKISFLAVPKNVQKINIGVLLLFVLAGVIEYLQYSKELYLVGFKSNLYWRAFVFLSTAFLIIVNYNPIKNQGAASQMLLVFAAIPFVAFAICLLFALKTSDKVVYDKDPYRIETGSESVLGGPSRLYLVKNKGFYEKMYLIPFEELSLYSDFYKRLLYDALRKEIQVREMEHGYIKIYFVGETTDSVIVETN